MRMLTRRDYEMAMMSQSAVNLSGIVFDFAKILERAWSEARSLGKGTDYVNTHPISRLFAEQIMYLAAGTADHHASYSMAYQAVSEAIKSMEG
jgi:hypothetical protein